MDKFSIQYKKLECIDGKYTFIHDDTIFIKDILIKYQEAFSYVEILDFQNKIIIRKDFDCILYEMYYKGDIEQTKFMTLLNNTVDFASKDFKFSYINTVLKKQFTIVFPDGIIKEVYINCVIFEN